MHSISFHYVPYASQHFLPVLTTQSSIEASSLLQYALRQLALRLNLLNAHRFKKHKKTARCKKQFRLPVEVLFKWVLLKWQDWHWVTNPDIESQNVINEYKWSLVWFNFWSQWKLIPWGDGDGVPAEPDLLSFNLRFFLYLTCDAWHMHGNVVQVARWREGWNKMKETSRHIQIRPLLPM